MRIFKEFEEPSLSSVTTFAICLNWPARAVTLLMEGAVLNGRPYEFVKIAPSEDVSYAILKEV